MFRVKRKKDKLRSGNPMNEEYMTGREGQRTRPPSGRPRFTSRLKAGTDRLRMLAFRTPASCVTHPTAQHSQRLRHLSSVLQVQPCICRGLCKHSPYSCCGNSPVLSHLPPLALRPLFRMACRDAARSSALPSSGKSASALSRAVPVPALAVGIRTLPEAAHALQ